MAEPPPETNRIRLADGPFLRFAPLYLAEDLLRLEGFRDIEYIRDETGIEDTLRFHPLRPHEVGMIKSTLQQIIARGTDWRFLRVEEGVEGVSSLAFSGERCSIGPQGGRSDLWIHPPGATSLRGG